jgi:hypothetical protein
VIPPAWPALRRADCVPHGRSWRLSFCVRRYELPADYATLVMQYRVHDGGLTDCVPRLYRPEDNGTELTREGLPLAWPKCQRSP